jgi:pimeloyl-ACP methyl ester carboxylesterase
LGEAKINLNEFYLNLNNQMKFILPDGNAIYYELHGNQNAESTLLFLGGLSQSTAAWLAYIPAFANEYRIVLADLMFQGQSDNPQNFRSFQEHAQDMNALLEGLKAKNVIAIGISYGGAVVMRMMHYFPERIRKAVLMATFAHKTPFFDAIGTSWQRALETGGYSLMLDVMLPFVLGKHYFQNPLIPIEMLKQMRINNDLSIERLSKLMTATAMSDDFRKELRNVQIPVLVICGSEDLLCTPEMHHDIVQALPNAQYVEIENVGHTLNLEAIPQTIALIQEFLKEK